LRKKKCCKKPPPLSCACDTRVAARLRGHDGLSGATLTLLEEGLGGVREDLESLLETRDLSLSSLGALLVVASCESAANVAVLRSVGVVIDTWLEDVAG